MEVILGTTKDEGILWVIEPIKNNSLFEEMRMDWDNKWGPLLMGIHDLDEVTDEDLSNSYKLLEFYIGGLENLNEDHFQSMFDMYTDSGMLFGVNRFKDIHVLFSAAKDDTVKEEIVNTDPFAGQRSFYSLTV